MKLLLLVGTLISAEVFAAGVLINNQLRERIQGLQMVQQEPSQMVKGQIKGAPLPLQEHANRPPSRRGGQSQFENNSNDNGSEIYGSGMSLQDIRRQRLKDRLEKLSGQGYGHNPNQQQAEQQPGKPIKPMISGIAVKNAPIQNQGKPLQAVPTIGVSNSSLLVKIKANIANAQSQSAEVNGPAPAAVPGKCMGRNFSNNMFCNPRPNKNLCEKSIICAWRE